MLANYYIFQDVRWNFVTTFIMVACTNSLASLLHKPLFAMFDIPVMLYIIAEHFLSPSTYFIHMINWHVHNIKPLGESTFACLSPCSLPNHPKVKECELVTGNHRLACLVIPKTSKIIQYWLTSIVWLHVLCCVSVLVSVATTRGCSHIYSPCLSQVWMSLRGDPEGP